MACTAFNKSFWVVSHISNTVLRIFMWQLGSPYNWWDTTLKKQSPALPTSNILKPCFAYQDCDNSTRLTDRETDRQTLSTHDGSYAVNGAVWIISLSWVTKGPGFDSVSPEVNNFAFETQYLWCRFQFFQIHHERQLILEMSFYASQFLFWKRKHN